MIPELGIIEEYSGRVLYWSDYVINPAAREVFDWLDGGYAVTGEMLQRQ